MKRMCAIVIMILAVSGAVFAEGRIKVSISGSMLVPSDSNYKNTYGNTVFFPEIKVGYKLFPETYIWVGYAYLYKEGQTPVLEADAKSTQHFLSLGVGYSNYIGEKFGYKMEVGLMRASYTEEALGEEVSDNTIGFRIDGGFSYSLTGNILAEISAGYLSASDTVQDVTVQLGGMRVSFGFVVVF